MRVTKEKVRQTAAILLDEKGLHGISHKDIAEKLEIRTPSLYNHIDSLDSLLREVAHTGMRQMNAGMEKAAIGKSGSKALQAVSIAYLDFIVEHPGIYETIQWATWNGTAETAAIFSQYMSLLRILLSSCGVKEMYMDEVLAIVTGEIHGYTTLQLRVAFAHPEEAREKLAAAVDTLLTGVFQKYC